MIKSNQLCPLNDYFKIWTLISPGNIAWGSR